MKAREYYKNAINSQEPGDEDKAACLAGLARTEIRAGDFRKGKGLAIQLDSPKIYEECAPILEELAQLTVRV